MLKPTVHACVEITRILSHTLPHTPSYTCVHALTYIHMRSLTHMRSLSPLFLPLFLRDLACGFLSLSLYTRMYFTKYLPPTFAHSHAVGLYWLHAWLI